MRAKILRTHGRSVPVANVLALLLLCLPTLIESLCPNACSGHGLCDKYTACHCHEDFFGHDCSQRKCPLGKAWGIVTGVNDAHSAIECSGRGTCQTDSGTCQCQQGFSGNACQLVDCPEACLAHGKCITMQEHAQNEVLSRELYDAAPFHYDSVWDADIIRGCRCDAGYSGPNCGQKRCPVGDDPLTTDQVNEVQLISCATTYTQQIVTLRADAALSQGTFRLVFGKQYTRPITYTALAMLDSSGTSVGSSLLALTGITAATVTRTDVSATQIEWAITLPASNAAHNALIPTWKVLEVQQFICAADTGTFSLTFGNSTVRNIPASADVNTFLNALSTIPFVGTIDVSFDGAVTVCSEAGTFVTMRFVQLWHRDYFGDLPPMTFSSLDTKGLVSLFLLKADGFIDTETKEVVKGIDTCRVIEQQQIECAATSGKFALTFQDGTKVTDIPFNVKAADLRSGIIGLVPYIVDVDVTYTAGITDACTTAGNIITLSFVVVKTTGTRGDGDLAETLADRTNGGVDGLNHISNRLRMVAAFTETVRGATCIAMDQTYTPDPANQIASQVVQGGGAFTVAFRGFTSPPIPAHSSPLQVKAVLESVPSIQGVEVTHAGAQACETPTNIMSVTFTQNFGNLPTVVVDGGALVAGSLISSVGGGQQLGAVTSIDGTKESNVCSNRGICDESKLGRCWCFLGYTSSNGRTGGGTNVALVNRGDCGATSRIPVGCPGDLACSGHGTCSGSPSFRCTCAKGWRGGDCSERLCPTDLAWFDYPTMNNVAHKRLRECSGVGSCDRSNGVCKCPRPYTGTACELMLCGGSSAECSGNGQCLTLNDLAPLVTVKGQLAGFSYGDDPNDPLTWDRSKIRSCVCDAGFFGYDCSQRECPRGDDPNTYDDKVERQLVQCVATGGSFTLTFRDQTTTSILSSSSTDDIKAALEAIPTISEVHVSFGTGTVACSATNSLIIIDFISELGDLPALSASASLLRDSVNGNGMDGSGRVVIAAGGSSLMGFQSVKGTRENAFCSNHGTCDFSTGICECDPQYGSSNGKGGPGSIGDCGYQFAPVMRDS